MSDYNKDYTALLLNCYVKLKQKDKITQLIERSQGQHKAESIFDINTAIEVCRQQDETLDQAEKLAENSHNYKLLVQIKIENRQDNIGALNIIDQKIENLKEKVQCLQQYVPKLLKQKKEDGAGKPDYIASSSKRIDHQRRILDNVKNIARALCEYTKNNKKKFDTEEFNKKFTLKSH